MISALDAMKMSIDSVGTNSNKDIVLALTNGPVDQSLIKVII